MQVAEPAARAYEQVLVSVEPYKAFRRDGFLLASACAIIGAG